MIFRHVAEHDQLAPKVGGRNGALPFAGAGAILREVGGLHLPRHRQALNPTIETCDEYFANASQINDAHVHIHGRPSHSPTDIMYNENLLPRSLITEFSYRDRS